MKARKPHILITIATAIFALVLGTSSAQAGMSSQRIAPKVCHTTGGGKFVDIREFPGEMVDRRLGKDLRRMIRKYNIFVTDGYSLDPVHSANGEHPVGLALDIVPNFVNGGSWRDINKLARWAEPVQNQPRAPFRWVGYDGDPNHGKGHHLHLSWNYEGRRQNAKPTRSVYTVRCPKSKGKGAPANPEAETPAEEPQPAPTEPAGDGGVKPEPTSDDRSSERESSGSGGIGPGSRKRKSAGTHFAHTFGPADWSELIGDPVAETAGVDHIDHGGDHDDHGHGH